MDIVRRKTVFLDLETIKVIAIENNVMGYKRSEEFITLWKRNEVIPGYYAYMTFQGINNVFRPIGNWESTNREPTNLLPLDRLGIVGGEK